MKPGLVLSLDGLDLGRARPRQAAKKELKKGTCRCIRTGFGPRRICRRQDGRVEIHGACKPRKR